MAQVTIYLPDDLARAVRREARRVRKSVSAYLAGVARERLRPQRWPDGFEELYGSWEGEFPEVDDPAPRDVDAL